MRDMQRKGLGMGSCAKKLFKKWETVLDKSSFERVASHFHPKEAAKLFFCDACGNWICGAKNAEMPPEILSMSIREAVRWGECNVLELADDSGAIVAPAMANSKLLGALVLFDKKLFCVSENFSGTIILSASQRLLEALDFENLTNRHLLESNNKAMNSARISAEILHEKKGMQLQPIRGSYIFREEYLLSAIKRGQRNQARKYLDEILIYIYAQCGDRIDLIKAHLIETAVMMIRGSLEMGSPEIRVFENSYRILSELSAAKDKESMSVLATSLLEDVMDSIESENSSVYERKFKQAFAYLKENFADPQLSRQKLAAYSKLSEKQLTLLFKKFTGKGFSENLSEMRISKACELMLSGMESATEIAYEVGFSDQSYFCKIFKKYSKLTTSDFRKKMERKNSKGRRKV